MPYDMQYSGWGPVWGVIMVILMVFFLSIFVLGSLAAARHFSRQYRHDERWMGSSSVETLKMRFAKGEIDEAEFRSRRSLLDETK